MRNWRIVFYVFLVFVAVRSSMLRAAVENEVHSIGIATIDITPDYPVRLSGYGNRREEFESVEQRIWAKAIAIGSDADEPAILITVDNCGVPDTMRAEVALRLEKKAGVKPDRLAICFSHTHCAPCLTGALVNIFSSDIPIEHQSRIDRYSRELTGNIEKVALAALADRQPSHLSWSVGNVTFARNRRVTWGGPVDHALPVMFVHRSDGKLRAVFANYACHATTLSFNYIHGDWPGTAMEAIERQYPGVIAMVRIGCGADQNPHPRRTVELVTTHGAEVAAEVARLLSNERVLAEGGYEGATAMVYYDQPTKFASGIENRIINALHELIPRKYLAQPH